MSSSNSLRKSNACRKSHNNRVTARIEDLHSTRDCLTPQFQVSGRCRSGFYNRLHGKSIEFAIFLTESPYNHTFMTDTEQQLLELFKKRSFRRAERGQTFQLVSGEKSEYFIDGKMTAVSSEGAALIGEVIYDWTKDAGLDAIGGLQVGAVPLTTAAVIGYQLHGRPIEGFWVREEIKSHGTQKLIEGALRKGMRVAVVDDVFTKGGSAMKAVEAVRGFGCEVVLVLGLVDRLRGARKLFQQNGITDFRAVFTIRDFGIDAPDASSEG
jgi:orotate phosphoribosyltransferase